jgi:hypothetical protein
LLLKVLPGEYTPRQRDQHHRRGDAEPDAPLPRALAPVAPMDLVGGEAQQARRHLRQRQNPAVAGVAHVGGEHLARPIADRAVGVDLEPQGRRKALALGVSRLAVDDHRNDRVRPAQRLELPHFLVDVAALRRRRRADDDQEPRRPQRGQRLLAQRVAGGEVLTVAKDRP